MVDENGDPNAEPGELEQADAGDPAVLKRKLTKAAIRSRESERFWRGIFADPVGRREMWGILQQAHAFEEIFSCGPNGFPQPEATWFHAGEQALGQRLYQSWILLAREGVFMMQDEHDPRFERPKMPQNKRETDG
jgi:hypothetical protein